MPSNAQIDAAQECINKGQETGKEHGFVMGEGGAASDVIAGEPGSVNLGPGYNQLSEGKISPQSDAHYHGYEFWVDDKGNTHSYTTQPSNNEDGTGDIPLRKSREESGLNSVNSPNWIMGEEPRTPAYINPSTGSVVPPKTRTSIRFYTGSKTQEPIRWKKFSKAVKKINNK